MSHDDVLFGYRLQLFDLAGRTSVSHACRTFGVHRSTYYAWKAQVDRHGLEVLRPRERRRPKMPNQLSVLVEERIVAFALGHPGLGPKRIASELARPLWGGIVVSANGVWRCLRRHGLNTRAKRLSLIAGYRSTRPLTLSEEALLPLFLFLRGTTYIGWMQSRPETETAKTMGPLLVERACLLASRYLTARGSV